MSLLSVNNLSFSHGTRQVLNGVTFAIEPGERVGLVGRNGTGKTTLMRIITGDMRADAGEVNATRGARVGYLAQDPEFDSELTVFQAAECAFAELHRAHEDLDRVTHDMADATGDELDRLLKKYERIEREIEHLGGFTIEHRIEETLHGLGLNDQQFTQCVHGLSGGERSRLALARLLLEEPDLLLLDEPTNHLDIDGRRWLENFLINEFRGAVLIVSHDRYLLDRVVSRILETEVDGTIATYPGNYAKFRKLRYERKLTQQREFEKQKDHIRREEQFIRRYKAGQRAKQAAGRESRLDRFKGSMTEKPIELETMRLNLPKPQRTGDLVLKVENMTKAYGERTLFEDFNFVVSRGDRIGVIGPNGAGKSTLVECMLGEETPDTGSSRFGSNVSLGYFSQLHEDIRLDYTVWQYLQSVIKSIDGNAKASEQQARDLAGAFLFSGDDQEKTLDMLSGGERARAILAGLVAGGHNLLVLDEPTNHFDIPSAERLEQALDAEDGFDGTVIVISHDRAFLDACVNQLIILDGQGGVRHFIGNYAEWRDHLDRKERDRKKRESEEAQRQVREAAKQSKKQASNGGGGRSKGKQQATADGASYASLEKWSMDKLESRIEEIQRRIREIDESFLDPATQRNGSKVAKLSDERTNLLAELEPLEFEWSRRADAT